MDHNFEEIPIIDLENLEYSNPKDLAEQLRDICHNIGFFVVVNHGIKEEIVLDTFDISKQLFDLPLEQKQLIDKKNSPHFMGWEAVGSELTNNQTDYREQVDIWNEYAPKEKDVKPRYYRLHGPNQWLPESVLPNYKTTVNRFRDGVNQLANSIMKLLAIGLELPEDYFNDRFGKEEMSLTKLIHYPKTPAGEYGVNEHLDGGFLTILAAGETPGLQVKNAADQWIPVPIIPNAFVINLGEMLQAMTGNYYVATLHRVFTNAERYSIAYFHGPSLDTPLSPALLAPKFIKAVNDSPHHTNAGYMSDGQDKGGSSDTQEQKDVVAVGDHIWHYLSRSYPDNMKRHYGE